MSQRRVVLSSEWQQEDELWSKRRKYESLDEFANEEGVEAVLAFLATNPTIIGDTYRHSKMKVLPYTVKRFNMGK